MKTLKVMLVFIIGVSIGALYEPVRSFFNHQWNSVQAFVAGHPLEAPTSVWQKIQNDLGQAPWRASRSAARAPEFAYRSLTLTETLGPILPESKLELYLNNSHSALEGYQGMLVKTPVDTGRGYSPALLLVGFDAKVHKLIPLDTESRCRCNQRKALNYFHIAGDPAELQTSGNILQNINSCGSIDWSVKSRYAFHHYLNNDGDHQRSAFWILDATDLVQIETGSGNILSRISLGDIINANPDLPVFESRLTRDRQGRWQYGDADFSPLGRTHTEVNNADHDPFHTNDVDEFTGVENGLFRKGDLVLSFRSTNLLLVVRPATLEIVWYSYGLTSRQHDPDFISANQIRVYDNNFHNTHSRIVTLEASAGSGEIFEFSSKREEQVNRVDGMAFHQLIEGYQFQLQHPRSLIFSAESYNAGIDLDSQQVFFAFRHQWREQAALEVDIERMLSPSEFDDIKQASCD